jgi:hypothetical protein
MNTANKASFGFKGVAFLLFAGLVTANCSSSKNATPANGGSGGGAGTSAAGATGTAGTGGAAGTSATAGTGGAAGTGAGGAAGTGGVGAGGSDGGVTDAGDGGMSCDPSVFPADAGCMPCATDPLLGCGTKDLLITCSPFNNAAIPANIPRL